MSIQKEHICTWKMMTKIKQIKIIVWIVGWVAKLCCSWLSLGKATCTSFWRNCNGIFKLWIQKNQWKICCKVETDELWKYFCWSNIIYSFMCVAVFDLCPLLKCACGQPVGAEWLCYLMLHAQTIMKAQGEGRKIRSISLFKTRHFMLEENVAKLKWSQQWPLWPY